MTAAGPHPGSPLPPPAPGWTPPPPTSPRDRVRGPAIAMMAAAGLVGIYVLGIGGFYAVMMFVGARQPGLGGAPPDVAPMIVGGTIAAVMGLLALAIAGFIGFAAWKMMRLESYALAIAATIATFVIGLPCSCCPVNTAVAWPIAIWAIVVLSDPAVKAAFDTPVTSVFD